MRKAEACSFTGGIHMKIHKIITQQIMQKLKEGTVPWHQPWSDNDWPRNLVSKRPYSGINVFLLITTRYSFPYWLTYNQCTQLGGKIKHGEKGTPIVYWKLLEFEDSDEEDKQIPFLRYYTVFNAHQCEGIDIPNNYEKKDHIHLLCNCNRVIDQMSNKPEIIYSHRAYYNARSDIINMPKSEYFDNSEELYSTLFHELIHATGHESRLNRKTLVDATYYGSTNYSKEELIAEMGSAFLCGHTGIENKTIDNSAAYIAGWLNRLNEDKKMVIMAAAQAHKAYEFIINERNKTLK